MECCAAVEGTIVHLCACGGVGPIPSAFSKRNEVRNSFGRLRWKQLAGDAAEIGFDDGGWLLRDYGCEGEVAERTAMSVRTQCMIC